MGYKNAQKRELMSSKTGEAIQKKKKETEAERLAREEKEDEEWGAPSPIAALRCSAAPPPADRLRPARQRSSARTTAPAPSPPHTRDARHSHPA